ncbi:DUF6879 family protein [Kitasatospora albolonga]
MRDAYAVDYEKGPFAECRAGFRHDPADRMSWWQPWLDLIAETVGHSVVMRRARTASEPVSEYIRYEHSCTFTNIATGEQVQWLPRRRVSEIALPGNNFWLFDDRLVRWNHFPGDGPPRPKAHHPSACGKLRGEAFMALWDRGRTAQPVRNQLTAPPGRPTHHHVPLLIGQGRARTRSRATARPPQGSRAHGHRAGRRVRLAPRQDVTHRERPHRPVRR